MDLIVKSRIEPASLTSSIRGVLVSIDRNQPISSISTMDQFMRDSVGSRRVTFILLGVFSALALVLAGIGIYGVISYSVAQRTQEIGIRMALGAGREDVMMMILLQGARIASAGLIIGMAAAFGLTRYLENLLFSVSPVRSRHVRHGRPCPRRSRPARLLHSRSPRLASRPDDRIAV